MPEASRARVRQVVRELLFSGVLGGEDEREAVVGDPVPVESPPGTTHSWFTPILRRSELIGYVLLRRDLAPLGYSGFARPQASDLWLDRDAIRSRAARLARPEETAEEPYLSFQSPANRLAWAVPLRGTDGRLRTVFVAGESVFESGPGENITG
jgi:hypothetical protein